MNYRALFTALGLFISVRYAGMAQSGNGGFETGDFTGWGSDQEGAAVTGDPRYVHSGIFGVELGAVGTLGHLTKTLPTIPGSNYLISLWLNNTNGGSPNEFQVTWNQSLLYDATNMPALAWTNIQLTVTASTPNDTLQLGFRQDPNFLGLDDVSVTSIGPAAPSIITQPTNETVTLSSNTAFVVTATGAPMPNYYWWRNGSPIAGGTGSAYSITNVQVADSGSQFVCVVSNVSGTATSQLATLTVIALPPTITQQPFSQSVVAGGYASFNVTASGSQPLTYFWRRNGSVIVGTTNSAYSTNNAQPGDSGSLFSCLVSNAFGTMLSSNALLIVTTNLLASTIVYLRTAAGEPWGRTDNDGILTLLYGAGWQALYYETVNPAALFSRTNRFIFMEGSADGEPAMETFLLNNLSALTNWVADGGSLFLDSAPYFINNFTVNVGFGVTLSVGDYSGTAGAANPAHPIFNGPFGPVGSSFSGGYLGHATVSGPGLSGILTNAGDGKLVLAERVYGAGHLMFGGATLPVFQTPQPQASNLWANILFDTGLQSAVVRTTLSLLPVGVENCTFSFWAEGPAGGSFFIQTSTNFQQWTTILTNTMPANGSVLIVDPSACNSNPRFYRGALRD
ncbi:MAG TPA: immunoglobulin domain-containing protein [Candidatus Binatia bacterium]|jgi:hypothetical protein|nr:immunoglobulin domain-containing protein [Candidatus Binatia bacterium]